MPVEGQDKHLHINRLGSETSPYLLQHAHNPVDWYPWGPEALRRAKAENRPIFLSIGYSACHWCHVMERESFEDEAIAEILNRHFVSIKVDREERPDLDEIYMMAVQLIAGAGGWPMSVFLTPDLKPFFAGTYFPPRASYGRPGFDTVLRAVAAAWEERPAAIIESAEQITAGVRQYLGHGEKPGDLDGTGNGPDVYESFFEAAEQDLRASFDAIEGGFGPAPKFPPSMAIGFLLRRYLHTREESVLHMATYTLEKMAKGGIYDHLGGGFHRYSTDESWLVPHFEKMLYDNALLAQAYIEAYQVTGNRLFRRVAVETLDYVLRDMRNPSGGFYSSEDADSEGEEGKFYLWTREEVLETLGETDGGIFCSAYGVEAEGNFALHEPGQPGTNVLSIPDVRDLSDEAAEQAFERMRRQLLAVRSRRVRPGRDEKILASWNALTISALAHGAQVLDDARYLAAARACASFVLAHMMRDGRLVRAYREEMGCVEGFLDDYAFLAVALLDLYETDFDLRWFDAAREVVDKMIALFWDPAGGGFFLSDDPVGDLIARTKPMHDGAEPSGNAMAALALLRLAAYTEKGYYAEKAQQILDTNADAMSRIPRGRMKMLCAADFAVSPRMEVAVAGSLDSPEAIALLRPLRGRFAPNTIVAGVDGAAPDDYCERISFLGSKTAISGRPTIYVCRDRVCDPPITTLEAFERVLSE